MRKCICSILCIVLLVSILASCGSNRQSPPTQSTEPNTYVDIEKKCYIINSTTHEILEQTTFTVKGQVDKTGLIDGVINVQAYPIDPETIQKHEALSQNCDSPDFIIYTCQILSLLDPECDTFYNVLISTTHPNIGMVYIYHNSESIMAVFAENEAEVWDNYATYLNLFQGKAE